MLLGACAAEHGPQLSSVTPAAVRGGEIVTIAGEHLCEGNCETAGRAVVIGDDTPVDRARSILDYEDTRATIAPAGETVLSAPVNERSSNALDFEVLPPNPGR